MGIIGATIIGATISVNKLNKDVKNATYRQQAIQIIQNQMEFIKAGNNEPLNGGKTLDDLWALTTIPSPHSFCLDSNDETFNIAKTYTPGDVVSDSSGYHFFHDSPLTEDAINSRYYTFENPTIYSSTATYSIGNVVSNPMGTQYVYIKATPGNSSTSTATDWQTVGGGGTATAYNSASAYPSPGSMVTSGSSYYINIAILSANSNILLNNTKYWISVDTDSNSNSYLEPNIYASSQSYQKGDVVLSTLNLKKYIYQSATPGTAIDPALNSGSSKWLKTNYMQYNLDSYGCNFNITGNKLLAASDSNKFYTIEMKLTGQSGGAGHHNYTIKGTITWNNIGAYRQASKVEIYQTMMSK